jgi:hypothetical protein
MNCLQVPLLELVRINREIVKQPHGRELFLHAHSAETSDPSGSVVSADAAFLNAILVTLG